MPEIVKAMFILMVLVVVLKLYLRKRKSPKTGAKGSGIWADGPTTGLSGSSPADFETPPANRPETSNWNVEPSKTSLFESDREKDFSRPFLDLFDHSMFAENKAHDLSRPINYGYNERMTTDLFELDKKDDLTRKIE